MTITFTAEYLDGDIRAYTGTCLADPTRFTVNRPTYTAANVETRAHAYGCADEDCRYFGGRVDADETTTWPTVTVANANATTLLAALGYAVNEDDEWQDLSGAAAADEFLGRVLVALAVAPADAGVPEHTALTNPRWIECGRRPGYLQDRLEQLRVLAETCQDAARRLTWA
ncbi:hypothetical protein JNW90_00935 [Micromonospora sp. STR1s_5]|nr:hypothetical protein [Micromonospora sp. STR1s_5]